MQKIVLLDLNFHQTFKKIISEASIFVRKFELPPALAGGYNLDIQFPPAKAGGNSKR